MVERGRGAVISSARFVPCLRDILRRKTSWQPTDERELEIERERRRERERERRRETDREKKTLSLSLFMKDHMPHPRQRKIILR